MWKDGDNNKILKLKDRHEWNLIKYHNFMCVWQSHGLMIGKDELDIILKKYEFLMPQ